MVLKCLGKQNECDKNSSTIVLLERSRIQNDFDDSKPSCTRCLNLKAKHLAKLGKKLKKSNVVKRHKLIHYLAKTRHGKFRKLFLIQSQNILCNCHQTETPKIKKKTSVSMQEKYCCKNKRGLCKKLLWYRL